MWPKVLPVKEWQLQLVDVLIEWRKYEGKINSKL